MNVSSASREIKIIPLYFGILTKLEVSPKGTHGKKYGIFIDLFCELIKNDNNNKTN